MNIDFIKDDNRVSARACAIIYNKDKSKVLLFKVNDGREYYLLPGGRIQLYEDSLTAIKREIDEELGYDIEFSIASIQENFVVKDNNKLTQYNFCYKGVYDKDLVENEFVCKDNSNQYFYWVDIDKLDDYKIYPESTYDIISSNEFKHIIERR
jgi:8-oxo-dGTP pyrophosphatase MutT (NUDIX family)